MESLRRIPSVLKILLIEIFAVVLFPVFVAGVINEMRPQTLAEHHNIDGAEWIYGFIGPMLVAFLLKDIFWPRIKREG